MLTVVDVDKIYTSQKSFILPKEFQCAIYTTDDGHCISTLKLHGSVALVYVVNI